MDTIVTFGVFILGALIGLGVANRIYVARSRVFTSQIESALDSVGIKRVEHVNLASDVTSLAIRVRHLEQSVSVLRTNI